MAKVKRETLRKFGCHEKQVEELMVELGHTIDDTQFDAKRVAIKQGTDYVTVYYTGLDGANILRIDSFGITLHTSVNKDTGLPLDRRGRVRVEERTT